MDIDKFLLLLCEAMIGESIPFVVNFDCEPYHAIVMLGDNSFIKVYTMGKSYRVNCVFDDSQEVTFYDCAAREQFDRVWSWFGEQL